MFRSIVQAEEYFRTGRILKEPEEDVRAGILRHRIVRFVTAPGPLGLESEERVWDRIVQHMPGFFPDNALADPEVARNRGKYYDYMMKLDTWGSQLELTVAATLYNAVIYVYDNGDRKKCTKIEPFPWFPKKPAVNVFYLRRINNNHYDPYLKASMRTKRGTR
jgi:hypothetical protein